MAVAVALGPALGAGLTVLGAAHRVGIGRQQGVDHGLQQTAHQVRAGLSQSLVKGSSRVDNVRSGHRDDVLSRIRWKVDSKDHTVTAPTTNTRASHRRLHHTTRHYLSRLGSFLLVRTRRRAPSSRTSASIWRTRSGSSARRRIPGRCTPSSPCSKGRPVWPAGTSPS